MDQMPACEPFLTRLRHLSRLEGASTLFLFGVAMPLKYAAGMPMAVRIAGSVHGALFVALVIGLVWGIKRIPITGGLAALGILAAVFPFGPFLFDRCLKPTPPAS